MVEPRIFLFLGQDEDQKQDKIDSLLKKFIPPELKDLNYTLLHADEKDLALADINEALFCAPTHGALRRLLVIKIAHKLGRQQVAGLIESLNKPSKTVLVLDTVEAEAFDNYLDEFKRLGANIVRFKGEAQVSAFDLGRSIMGRHPESALKILSVLLKYRDKTEKILGAIFWQWERSYSDRRISDNNYRRGLKFILDADKRLKSSSSSMRQALILETLVVKLSYLA